MSGIGPRSTPRARRSDRTWQVGLVLGAAAGITAKLLERRAGSVATKGLVDWDRAERIARGRFERAPGRLTAAELRAAEPAYQAAMAKIVPLLEQRLGSPLPGVVERHAVVDRGGWAAANLVTFRQLVRRLEDTFARKLLRGDGTLSSSITVLANRYISTQQIGFLLGFLGNRVLGQYDVALLSAEAPPGRLLFVEENIRQTAVALDVPLDDFRTWIALHETTHAFEFEAHPWLRPYLAERIERQLGGLLDEVEAVDSEGLAGTLRRLRRAGRQGGNLLTRFLDPEQRRLLKETQLVMSLLEGFSDWVMDEVGAQVIGDVDRIRDRFEARRSQRKRGLEGIVSRLTGLDMKLEQYRRGERFVSGVAAAGGQAAVAQLFAGPWALPTEAEMEEPERWVRRVVPSALGSGTQRSGRRLLPWTR